MSYVTCINKGIEQYMPEIKQKYPTSDFKYMQQVPYNNTTCLHKIHADIHDMTQKFIGSFAKLPINVQVRKKLSDKQVIFVCWFQGEDNMPDIVKLCYNNLKRYNQDRTIILITFANIGDYIDVDCNIKRCLDKGTISYTFFSDYIRLALLAKYEGIWLDATLCCTYRIPDYYFTDPLLIVKNDSVYNSKQAIKIFLKTYKYVPIAYLLAGSDNRLYCLALSVMKQYFESHCYIVNYFFINDILEYVIQNDELVYKQWQKCRTNNENIESAIISKTKLRKTFDKSDLFFKLTYKGTHFSEIELNKLFK